VVGPGNVDLKIGKWQLVGGVHFIDYKCKDEEFPMFNDRDAFCGTGMVVFIAGGNNGR
jgi:hypothetical protein